jgi:hypothetical protein
MKRIIKMVKRYRIAAPALIVISLGMVMLLSGCNLFGLKPEGNGRTGSLRLTLSGVQTGSRSVVADPGQISIDSYSVRLECHDGYPTRNLSSSASPLTVSDLELGTWDIKVDALRGSSIVAHGEALDQVVAAGDPLSVTINLSMTQDGTGGFSLAVTFPASTGIDYVRGALSKLDGTVVGAALVPTITTAGEEKSCVFAMSDVPSGAYVLSMDFRRGGEAGTPAGVFGEAVNIWDNVVSDRWVNPSNSTPLEKRTFAIGDFFSMNSSLAAMMISDQSGDLPMTPSFSSTVHEYTVSSYDHFISLRVVQSIEGQSFAYSLNNAMTWETLRSGEDSSSIELDSTTLTTVIVRSTAPDGVSAIFTKINVHRIIPVSGLSLNRSFLPLVVGKSNRVVATIAPADATDSSLVWQSSDALVATVEQDGTVTGIAAGRTIITVTSNDGGFFRSVNVSVYPVINVYNAPTRLAGYPGASLAHDGVGISGSFSDPAGLCALGGIIYIADAGSVRRFDPSTRALTTLAGTAGVIGGTSSDGIGSSAIFHDTNAICTDGEYLYVTEGQGSRLVRRIDPTTAEVVTVAGPDSFGGQLAGVCSDETYLYVAEMGAIKKIDLATHEITSLAGLSSDCRIVDGDLATARFSFLYGITMAGTKIYAQDSQCLRLIDLAAGTVTSIEPFAGTYLPARDLGVFAYAGYIYLGQSLSYLYSGSYWTTNTLERLPLENVSSGAYRQLIAGYNGVVKPNQSADGVGRTARFGKIQGIAAIGTTMYVVDAGNMTLRSVNLATITEMDSACSVETVAGTAVAQGSSDGEADRARFNAPAGICIAGEFYFITDRDNVTLRKYLRTSGTVTTISGSPGVFTGSDAVFSGLPNGVCELNGQLYVLDTSGTIFGVDDISGMLNPVITHAGNRGICSDGRDLYSVGTRNVVYKNGSIFAGTESAGAYVDGIGTDARFNNPTSITSDGVYLYIADAGNKAIRRIEILTREVSTVRLMSDSVSLTAIGTDGTKLYVADNSERFYVINLDPLSYSVAYTLPYVLGVLVDESGLIATSIKSADGRYSNIVLRAR